MNKPGQEDDFLSEMRDVKPLRQDLADVGRKPEDSPGLHRRREAAVEQAGRDNPLSSTLVREVGPYDIASFKRDGIQEGVFRKLRMGKYPCDIRLDLHRMTVEEARKAVYDFVHECMEYDVRTFLLLHGKGDRTPEKKAILKSHVIHWLEEMPDVMAFHSAQPQHGGAGALYVLLRKSDSAKSLNRERHGVRA